MEAIPFSRMYPRWSSTPSGTIGKVVISRKYLSQRSSPNSTSRSACSRVSATCIMDTTRQRDRSAWWPFSAEMTSQVSQFVACAARPESVVLPIESRPRPYLPAVRAPTGERADATAISTIGLV